MENQKVSLADIAAKLNLSKSAVSRGLRNLPGVSPHIARKTQRVAADMGYKASPYRANKSLCVGMIFPDSSSPNSPHFKEILAIAERHLSLSGMHLMVHYIQQPLPPVLPQLIKDNRVDGVVLAGYHQINFINLLKTSGKPIVAVNNLTSRTSCDCVISNPWPGTSDLLKRLTALGHKRIALVLSDRIYPTVERRYQAFILGMNECGHSSIADLILENYDATIGGGAMAVAELLSRHAIPSAIVFVNDWMALGGMMELTRRGLRIPEDISIASYDNTYFCEETLPRLTSVDLHIEKSVVSAIDELLTLITEGSSREADQFTQREVSSELVWRDSCAAAKTCVCNEVKFLNRSSG